MEFKLGYMIPEFPGQTHIWIWRERTHLHEWGVQTEIFSTKRPLPRDRARHDFAEAAEAGTRYLWPLSVPQAVRALLWAASRPLGLLRCIKLGLTLPVDQRPPWRTVLPLLLPACQLAREADRLGVTWIHTHTCRNGAILCMMAKRLLGTPFSMTLNANIEIWGGAMQSKFEDADFTIAITNWLLKQMRRDYPSLSPRQALLGRIGVDTRKWVPAEKPRDRLIGPTRLLTLGRLHATKGHDTLLKAVSLLVRDGSDVTLELIGDGPERPSLEAMAAGYGLSGRATFHGSLGEAGIIEMMHDADIFILASHSEPLGVAYMEAMAMEVATIGTDAGGVREIITDGENGLLVPPQDPESLACAIRRLTQDRAFRDRIARAGRQSIVERFDSRLGAATLYERLFGHPPPSSEHNGPAVSRTSSSGQFYTAD
jgi:colanic acid/amylovoran biosynthesis glycosyltransferase